jgi:hypothetical protein
VWPAFALVTGLLLVGVVAEPDGLFRVAGAASRSADSLRRGLHVELCFAVPAGLEPVEPDRPARVARPTSVRRYSLIGAVLLPVSLAAALTASYGSGS